MIIMHFLKIIKFVFNIIVINLKNKNIFLCDLFQCEAFDRFWILFGDDQSRGRLRPLRGGGRQGRGAHNPAAHEARGARGHPARGAGGPARDARHGHALHRERRSCNRGRGGGGRRTRGTGRHACRRSAAEVPVAQDRGLVNA